ncbi:hypothetical protein BDV95DRAFT_605762 [Massariosphaeria phaeospora]|uniref:Uncharacterized protein n=1 Tax=Massariosphaeria phaeospora TaxID=100035 RepID=A0A7C8IA82_9PLEO|nr:hypothetical protein BDV95DRAFT_605762 [Massariosphaeria phaeospora]
MPLRKRLTVPADADEGKAEVKKSRRQRVVEFFRKRKNRAEDSKIVAIPAPTRTTAGPRKYSRGSNPANAPEPAPSSQPDEAAGDDGVKVDEGRPVSPMGQPQGESPEEPLKESQKQEEAKVELLSEDQIKTLFSGAPHFSLKSRGSRLEPAVAYPWDEQLEVTDVSDCVQLAHPAYSAATLRRHLPALQQSSDQEQQYLCYDIGLVENPSMLAVQGTEPGTVGFIHFLEMPIADSLVTDLQQSQSSNGYLESVRNKEQFHKSPERLGIRPLNLNLLHDRLIEFGDLLEAFHDSPERMTIFNNQSTGELYTHLFGKFLTPPPYDGTVDDPTGVKVQIDTLLKILRLKGVWFDFSLVEWRIRLGQILWSEPDMHPEDTRPLWSDREILLLQITLACELLLRLEAVSSSEIDEITQKMHVTRQDYEGFLKLKTKKTDWDLVLARRFLENILVVKGGNTEVPPPAPKRGLMSMLSKSESRAEPPPEPESEIIFLPRHQARQLAGLLHFAETVQWPGIEQIVGELAEKLKVPDNSKEPEQLPSPYGRFVETVTPSSVSVYGTPLGSPRFFGGPSDSYFGNVENRPALSRGNSRSLAIPISTTVLTEPNDPTNTLNIGGWLSRSYLTGMVLPGEAISHFLISTLLENDKSAIHALGDSANLYGGFVYSRRSWWSKSSVVGRVLACVEGAVECMGWVSLPKCPKDCVDGWFEISSEQLPFVRPYRITNGQDMVDRDSDIIPGGNYDGVNPAHLALPTDPSTAPAPSVEFTAWDLASVSGTAADHDTASAALSGTDAHDASLTFTSQARGTTHTFTLTHDVYFITSFPCTAPTSLPLPNAPQILKRSSSRTSSKRTVSPSRPLNRRNSSYGYEPLLSHPPDSPDNEPKPVHPPLPAASSSASKDSGAVLVESKPMTAHPLHASYPYKLVATSELLDPYFFVPFWASSAHTSRTPSMVEDGENAPVSASKMVLVLDARASAALELLARAWCAEKGYHALVGRVGRTCLACCVREARGLGVNVVIRV